MTLTTLSHPDHDKLGVLAPVPVLRHRMLASIWRRPCSCTVSLAFSQLQLQLGPVKLLGLHVPHIREIMLQVPPVTIAG